MEERLAFNQMEGTAASLPETRKVVKFAEEFQPGFCQADVQTPRDRGDASRSTAAGSNGPTPTSKVSHGQGDQDAAPDLSHAKPVIAGNVASSEEAAQAEASRATRSGMIPRTLSRAFTAGIGTATATPDWLRQRTRLLCLDFMRGPQNKEDRVRFHRKEVPPLFPRLDGLIVAPFDFLVAKTAFLVHHARKHISHTSKKLERIRKTSIWESSQTASEALSHQTALQTRDLERSEQLPSVGEADGPEDSNRASADAAEDERTARSIARRLYQGLTICIAVVMLVIVYYYLAFASSSGDPLDPPLPLKANSFLSKFDINVFGSGACGLLGGECRGSAALLPVRCPGLGSKTPNGTIVGSNPYRGDSTLCPAAIHAGLVDKWGGCFNVQVSGPVNSFPGSTANGVTGRSFDSWFPGSISLLPMPGAQYCSFELWWVPCVLTNAFLFILAMFRPRRQLFWWSMLTSFYWYVALTGNQEMLQMRDVMQTLGGFVLFALSSQTFLWKFGRADASFTDTASGRPLEVLLFELLPMQLLLHIQLLAPLVGDYDLTPKGLSQTGGKLLYGLGLAVLLPLVIYLLRRWYLAGALRQLFLGVAGVVVAIGILSIFVSKTTRWGLHLHHYFMGLLGYLGARGDSKVAVVVRAISLGSFINGLSLWGQQLSLPIWSASDALVIPTTKVELYLTFPTMPALLWTQAAMVSTGMVYLSWASQWQLDSNCQTFFQNSQSTYVVEMNNVTMYRGPLQSTAISLPVAPTGPAPQRYYFTVGQLDNTWTDTVIVKSGTLVVPANGSFPFAALTNCEKIRAMNNGLPPTR